MQFICCSTKKVGNFNSLSLASHKAKASEFLISSYLLPLRVSQGTMCQNQRCLSVVGVPADHGQ